MKSQREKICDEVRRIIYTYFNVESIESAKDKLRKAAKYEYGCRSCHIRLKEGITLIYTDNDNCFASYIIRLQGVGMASEYAFDRQSITREGKKRGCDNPNHYLFTNSN